MNSVNSTVVNTSLQLVALVSFFSQSVFANSFSTSNNFDVASYSDIVYIQELESLHLLLTQDNIQQAQSDAQADPKSTTVIAENVEVCILSNNKDGLILNIMPTSFGTLTHQDAGRQQDTMTNGDMLRFYNKDQNHYLPFFLRVKSNQKAEGSNLIGKNDDFTISGSVAPFGSMLYNLQAGVDGKIDHFDMTSTYNDQFKNDGNGCQGGPLRYNIEILNTDIAKARKGRYQTAFTISVRSIS